MCACVCVCFDLWSSVALLLLRKVGVRVFEQAVQPMAVSPPQCAECEDCFKLRCVCPGPKQACATAATVVSWYRQLQGIEGEDSQVKCSCVDSLESHCD